MRRKIVQVALILVCIVLLIHFVYCASQYFNSKRLVNAICEENVAKVEQIVLFHPDCINTYPNTKLDKLIRVVTDEHNLDYPLTTACVVGDHEIIKLLIEHGADPNCNDEFCTPLSVTYRMKLPGWYDVSQYLIDNGALLEYKLGYGEGTIIADISGRGQDQEDEENVRKSFLYVMEHADHTQIDWSLALNRSVCNNRIAMTRYLLDENYVNVNAMDNGYTVLMNAASNSSPEMVQLLLDHGADKTMVDPDNGMTAYDYAVQFGNEENAVLLK